MKTTIKCALLALASLSAIAEGDLNASVTLRDASVIKGTVAQDTAIEGAVVFADGVKIPLPLVRGMASDGTNGEQIITLANGDVLHIAPKTKALAVTTMLGDLSIPLANIRKVAFSSANSATDGLIYYCTFDSPEAIRKPAVGPAGEFLSGRFVEGKVGEALAITPGSCAVQTPIPAGFFGSKGCIEFWGRIDADCKSAVWFGGAGYPVFFHCQPPNDIWKLTVMWNPNNGVGHSGLCGAVQHYPASSDAHTGETYLKYLDETEAKWHHYALVWNTEGIPSLGSQNGVTVKVAVYLDGEPISTHTNVRNPVWGLSCFTTTPMILGFPMPPGQEGFNKLPFSIDEFKIWNFDKVEF